MSTTLGEIYNPAIPGLPPKDVVGRLCKKKGFDSNTLTYSAEGNTFFIKYNNATMEEAHAQVFFRQKSRESNATFRIPEVYHAFIVGEGGGTGRGYTYIVMEHIEIDFERTASDEQRAQAISELTVFHRRLVSLGALVVAPRGIISSETASLLFRFRPPQNLNIISIE
jgi:hypothetical protein